jgi:hypothetical protein
MEWGYLFGERGGLAWYPPEQTASGPRFSFRMKAEVVSPSHAVFLERPPLALRCKDCEIYWIRPPLGAGEPLLLESEDSSPEGGR